MKHFSVTFKGEDKKISIHAGATVLEAAGQAGIILNSICGGKGLCKKCMVYIEPSEKQVLACQYHIQSNIVVTVPAQSRFYEQKILEHGIDIKTEIHPAVCKRYLRNDCAEPDKLIMTLSKKFPQEKFRLSTRAKKQLQQLSKNTKFCDGLTAVCYLDSTSQRQKQPSYQYTVELFEEGNTTSRMFGLAADIGTTTVVIKLIDLNTGKCTATQSAINPQSRFGDDVISRITYARTDEKLTKLHNVIIDCFNELTGKLCKQYGINAGSIYEATAVGNTTMNHIFLNFPITQLGQAPYKAFSIDAHDKLASEMALKVSVAGKVHSVANIAGFVGSDTVAVALAVDIDSADEMTLIVDIGTNGEIVLGTKDKLYAASCAAGPALEGARISCGSRAAEGAIEAVVVNESDIDLDVIGNCPARSICGSGLIDAVAALLNLGILDQSGRFVEPEKLQDKLPTKILSRIVQQNGQPAFVLAENQDLSGQRVLLAQKDIREVQLAKGAIRTGITLLQKKFGLEDKDIKKILLAGAFGNYIRPESALRIGLLPDVPAERIHFVGNAASSGAQMVLLSRDVRILATRLARKIKYIEIAHEPTFQDVFADSMMF
ncbi:MAG: DUF4445 domain-containing protein [Sedimentisphaerales bacterium]|nr:DUF4445 domain-containing protein [Sedimentisphaerales bacterium]